jgi:hypothetical protein
MITLSQCQKVFEGEGFLSNDPGSGSPYRHISHISKENPVRLLNRLYKFGYYYDKCKFDTLLNAKVNILEDKDVVLNEFNGKIVNFYEELYAWIKYSNHNCEWRYVEYAK